MLKASLRGARQIWCVAGVAGFIGSNLLEMLRGYDQSAIGLDNFSTGYRQNLDLVRDCIVP